MKNAKIKIGIYSGSFNPVHKGHVSLASYLLAHTDLDEVWMVLSPQNPLKVNAALLADDLRYRMLQLALEDVEGVEPCDVELLMPKPSYTYLTLLKLVQDFPDKEFSLIIGADNLELFDRWKEYRYILQHHRLIVYPRAGHSVSTRQLQGDIVVVDAPLFNVSSTDIRTCLRSGESADNLVPQKVLDYIKENKLYL